MITSGHILDAQSLLLGEYSTVYSPRNCSFPEITTPHHSGPIKRDAPDSFMVQGILTSGAVASMSLVLTTSNNPSEFTWTISGEKGALRMEGPNINIQMLGPKLSWYHDGKWEEVALRDPLAFGQVGDLYHAIASGKTLPDSIVDFDGAAMRHRMLEEERRRGYTTVIPLGINHKAPISQQLLKSSS
jgi:predicted dehydrogenase